MEELSMELVLELLMQVVLVAGASVVLLVLCSVAIRRYWKFWYLFGRRSPFSIESVRPPAPREMDQSKRDKVIKNGFSVDKVPQKLDAIVIGSGMGGLTVAAVLAKAGKKVLVVEKNEQAGGNTRTFIEEGFEFDVGPNHIGQLHENGLFRIIFDQISEGQLEFQQLEEHVDTIQIGEGEEMREYTILSGKTQMEAHLKKQFPDDEDAVETLFKVMKVASTKVYYLCMLKMMPRWLSLLLLRTGIAKSMSPIFGLSGTSNTTLLETLTSNKDLQVVFSHLFHGVPPKDSSVVIDGLVFNHYKRGNYYPKGGASEIAYHIIRTIQKHEGQCLVKAPVTQILVNDRNVAYGVRVRHGKEEVEIRAPVVVSNCGFFNTFQKLVPSHITSRPAVQERMEIMKHGRGSVMVYCGLEGTKEELGLTSTTFWLFKNNRMDQSMEEYFALSKDEAPDNIPMMMITVTSAKDLEAAKFRQPGKTSMTILTMVNHDWFEADTKRDEAYKMRFGNNMFNWACTVLPKIKDKLVHQTVASPGHKHCPSLYPAEHNLDRFQVEAVARNRCDTPVKKLFITGQDVMMNGIGGAMQGGILSASAVRNHIYHIDLLYLKKELKKRKRKEVAELEDIKKRL